MKSLFIGLLLLLTIVPALANDNPYYEPFECPAATHNLRTTVDCGYVIVPEDHGQPDGPLIKIATATLHSFSDSPAPDPVIYLQGGPGSAAILPALKNMGMLQMLVPALENRHVILMDQRGIGLSLPRLGCPALDTLYVQIVPGSQSEALTQQSLDMLRNCQDDYVAQGVNLAAYDTRQNAADVAAVAAVLGYEQVNLYGISYGTRLGLTVMRDHPEGIRSVALNAVLPFDIDIAQEDPANLQRSFQTVFAACDASIMCRWAYPNLEEVFYGVFDDLNAHPLNVRIETDDGRVFVFDMDGKTLMETLFFMLYSSETISAIPSIIYGLKERDSSQYADFVPIPKPSDPDASGGDIMSLSVMCSDFVPFMNWSNVNLDVPAPFHDMGIFNSPRFSLCPDWPTATPDPLGSTPLQSDIPTLILTGSMDHVTPTHWGARVASTLPNSFVYNFPTQSHGVSGDCVESILMHFLDQPTAQPQSDCIAEERPVQFMIGAAGTRPWAGYSLIVIGSVALGLSGYTSFSALRRRHFPWLHSFRAIGWLPMAVTALVLGVLLLIPEASGVGVEPFMKARLVETIVPLALAIQAAFILPPDDEPALEILMTYPRPLAWLVLERFAVIWIGQGLIAIISVVVTVMVTGSDDVGLALVRWIPPAVLLGGLSFNAALRSRKAVFGVLVAGLVWFALAFFGEAFLPGQMTTFPMNYIQPLFWPFHAYLQPGDLLAHDYWLNRVFVLAVGLNLVALAVLYVRDSERLLLGRPALKLKSERKQAS